MNAVIRTGLFSLLRQGYVEVIASKTKRFASAVSKLRQADFPPPSAALTPLERALFRACEPTATPADLFRNKGVAAEFEPYCEAYREGLESEGLILPEEIKRAALPTWAIAAFVLLALAGYKLVVAMAKGRTNVGFLLTMVPFALIILTIVVAIAAARRRTARGE